MSGLDEEQKVQEPAHNRSIDGYKDLRYDGR